MMPPFRMEETLKKYKESVTKKFCKTGFPVISNCIFVSGTTGENMEHLRSVIYKEARKMNKEADMGKMVIQILNILTKIF